MKDITDNLRQFIFEHIDSVGQLDVLFYMRDKPTEYFNAANLATELRTSVNSSSACITLLVRSQLLVEHETIKGDYKYSPKNAELEAVVTHLSSVYKIKPHQVLELIFSSAKRARQFANAFSISKITNPEDDHG